MGYLPINANATTNTKRLLQYIYSLKGTNILSGHHNWINDPTGSAWTVYKELSKYPAINGMEIGVFEPTFTQYQIKQYRQGLVAAAQKVHNSGGIVTIMMHHSYPGAERSWPNVQRKTTQEEFNEIITPGTEMYNKWMADIDEVAVYLKQIQDLDIPVLWRPYHEMNGQWFWWGVKENYTQLWDNLYDRLTNYHGINNLLWVWNCNAPNGYTDPATKVKVFEYDNPGIWVTPNRADIFAIDVYNNDFQQKYHDNLQSISGGKPIALGEVGRMPSRQVLSTQPEWSWFMVWPNYWNDTPENERLNIYSDPKVITRDEVQLPN